MQQLYVIGKQTNGEPGRPALEGRVKVRTLHAAEAYVADVLAKRDPDGVVNGLYSIDGPCEADTLKDVPFALSESAFRLVVKRRWSHVKISIRTVSFEDLARASCKCLSVSGDRPGEVAEINALANQAGILPDGNIRVGAQS